MADWEQSIARYRLLVPGDRVIVGVSGGPDSMALLHLLQESAKIYDCTLYVVHINHSLRGQQAEEEARFVAQWCQSAAIDCRVVTCDVRALAVREGLSIEQAGHQARFAAYRQAAAEVGANKLALGHHRNDRAETVLLHLLQGCALDGLAAMPPEENGVIRPLIDASKEDLLAYCRENALPYYWDASNDEPIYLRNRIRLELLPHLQEAYNPQIVQNLVHLAILAAEDKQYLDAQTEAALAECAVLSSGQAQLALARWRQLPQALGRRVLRRCYQWLRPENQGLSFQQTDALYQLAQGNQGAKRLDLPGRVCALKSYDGLTFVPREEVQATGAYAYVWHWPKELWAARAGVLFRAELSDRPFSYTDDFNQVVLDADRLDSRLVIRSRRPGDRLRPLGMQGEKKLKAYFIDKKTPLALRDRLPLVFSGDTLIWIPGYTIAESYQAGALTKNFCRMTAIFADEAGILPEINETN